MPVEAAAKHGQDNEALDCYGKQPGCASHRIIDTRSTACTPGIHRTHNRRGQRRDTARRTQQRGDALAPAQAGAGRHYLLSWRMVSVLPSGIARLSAGLAAAAGRESHTRSDFPADAEALVALHPHSFPDRILQGPRDAQRD